MSISNIPKEPAMLLSYVNTELRDNYCDLVEFCFDKNVDINTITGTLRTIDYVYDKSLNQFI